MAEPWNEGVRGTQVLPLINRDAPAIRVEAGPGTGKTFGLTRRVQRILHPHGLNVPSEGVLIVAFNRVIAKDLRDAIGERLNGTDLGMPVIRTVHALCLEVIGTPVRLLLPHEREGMLYDVLHEHSALAQKYARLSDAEQALRDHEAKNADHTTLWQAVQQWLVRHRANLISELPSLFLDRLNSGDFGDRAYEHVIVDEFQDLTAGEQELFAKLRTENGSLVVLGDPRQSIYRFRGNDLEGLSKLPALIDGMTITDLPMTECQRCPTNIVSAANQLMALSPAQKMVAGKSEVGNIHVVYWSSPKNEAAGMAKAILANVSAHANDKHLVMVTRRQFGYMLREELVGLDSSFKAELSFSESLLEAWPVRESFLFFCLLADPDPATWRAWLGYQNSDTGKDFKAAKRNADAYLKLLTANSDVITDAALTSLAAEPQGQRRGDGGKTIWERAKRFIDLRGGLVSDGRFAEALINEVLSANKWISSASSDEETARLDMELVRAYAITLLDGISEEETSPQVQLREVARRLRYQIATREPFEPAGNSNLLIATLWGAKGVNAEHVYVLGLCEEAIPGKRRDEYPGTDNEYREEQRRLFYVSLTRSKKTLVLSRATHIQRKESWRLGLEVQGNGHVAALGMCPFLRDIQSYIPQATDGAGWAGC